ncbi:SsgA family sporulation/cell division regulator [Prauserella muralis]|uniref:Sporulation protein SsgA n=1 Tax=Prauserella muralis TaxID=588067 RepID=A0A2V4B9D9_9PSEU|nr:SsgA family sporulation/cell division regulator [Prauserella muralis]PXY31887.1 sporulation protein SsgA [Prauserella muralis]TWE13696.1 sporulation and cell division protein SsgA [Prauserella muralis]
MRNDAVHQSQFVYLNGCSTPVLSRLAYTTAEPFTVALAFRIEPGEWVEWEFARDLLITGLTEPAGIGDVRVRPDLSLDEGILVLELESPDGYAVVELGRDDVARFVQATTEFVAPGAESEHLDLDSLIADLTAARP